MPGWLSPAERSALDAFPAQIGPEDLDKHFKLSPADMRFALKHRGDSRLGVAVQLCALRWLGFIPDALTEIPQPALLELCDQLEANSPDLDDYGARDQTRIGLVEELVARAAGSGLDVALRLEGQREGLPAPLVQAAYRVVQEGLTNALRYASGAPVSVIVRGEPAALVIEVSNGPAAGDAALAGTGTGTGNGIRGLRERVGACGGTLEAGASPDRGWRLAARLPLRVGAARPAEPEQPTDSRFRRPVTRASSPRVTAGEGDHPAG